MVDAWAIDASGGAPSYNGQDLRLGTTLPFVSGAGASLGVRSGVRPSGSGTDLLVQAQSSPNMSVKINPGVIVAQGAISTTQGPYTWALDTVLTRTIAAAHATLARTDLVVVRIRDANVDTSGGRDGDVIVITGTAGAGVPALPTDATYIEIGRVAVGAGVTSIVAGNVDTSRRPFTTGLGGVLLCDANSEPAATSVPANQLAHRSDLGVFRAPSGSSWKMVTPYRQDIVLSGAAASVTLSGLPSGLRSLRIKVSARGDTAQITQLLTMRVNSDASASYFGVRSSTVNATTTPANYASNTQAIVGIITGANAGGGHYGEVVIDIAGWNRTDRPLNFLYQSITYPLAANSTSETGGGVYNASVAFTSITFIPFAGNFVAGSEFHLEGWD